jgi:predicted MFS family arabinose efflux permease
MFFLGVGGTIIGGAARNIGLTPYQIGVFISIQNLGFMVSVTISGALSDTYEKPKILFIGSAVLALSFLTFYLSPSFLLNLVIMGFIGMGMGAYEGVSDATLLDIHKERESLYINVNHFFLTFGSLLITLYLVFLQMNWRKAVTQSGIAVALLALFFLFTKLEKRKRALETLSKRFRLLAQERVVILLFLAMIGAAGLETGSVGIMTTFLMDLRNFTQVTSKIGLMIFLAGIAGGRLLVGSLTKRNQILDCILILFSCSTLFLGSLFFIDAGRLTYVIVFLSGTTVSALLPMIITLAGLEYEKLSGTVLGIIKIAIPIGGMLVPFLISVISKTMSFQGSLLVFPSISFLSFLMLLLNSRAFHRFTLAGETSGPSLDARAH